MDEESSRAVRPGEWTPAEKINYNYWIGALVLTLGIRLYLFSNYYTINNDGVVYIETARRFWEGHWLEGLASFYPPLFPLMIAVAFPVTGDWELAGQFWPFILSILALFPLYGLLKPIYGERIAQAALFFYALNPYLARLSLHVRSEMPYIFFLLLALCYLRKTMDQKGVMAPFLAGISSGLAYLARSEALGILVVGASFLLYRKWLGSRLADGSRQLTFLAAGFLIFAAPYVGYLRWDTGRWMVSRKLASSISQGLLAHDPTWKHGLAKEPDRLSAGRLVADNFPAYSKKVFVDFFRSAGAYLEALHYSYLLFFAVGSVLFFRGRFWEKGDFVLAVFVVFYLVGFSLLYVTRRYTVPLVPMSLGWVAAGFLAVNEYFHNRSQRTGYLFMGIFLVLLVVGTMPKTLTAIGREKLYMREAGVYLKDKPGSPAIFTSEGRVAFYAQGANRVLTGEPKEILGASAREGDYLVLDRKTFEPTKTSLGLKGWVLEREFLNQDGEGLLILRLEKGL